MKWGKNMNYTQAMKICRAAIIEKSEQQKSSMGRGFDRVSCYTYLGKYWGEISLKKANAIINDLYKDGLLEKE